MKNRRRGASLILAVMIMTGMGAILGGLAAIGRLSILGGQTIVFTDDVFFVAESGIEAGIDYIRNIDTDLKWYNNADPLTGIVKPALNFSLGAAQQVSLKVKYPAMALYEDVPTPSSASYLEVFSKECFKWGKPLPSGEVFYVCVRKDIIKISAFDANHQRLLIDPTGSSDPFVSINTDPSNSYSAGADVVYPVTKLEADIGISDTILIVKNTRGFLPAGTIRLIKKTTNEEEIIRYRRITDTSFEGCQRGSNNTVAKDPAASEILNHEWKILPVNYEATLVSTGTSHGVSKTLEVTIQYKEW